MLADAGELKADCRACVRRGRDGKLFVLGKEGRFGDAFFACDVIDLKAFASGIAEEVFFPAGDAAIGAEELGLVRWEVTEAEVFVGHGEH